MKQTFTTLLTALYLISSVGFGGVQQYCNSAQKIMLSGEAQCCSEEAESAPKQAEPSCCSLESNGPLLVQGDKTWNAGCCVFKQIYHQVDTSPTPQQDKLSQDSRCLVELIHFSQQSSASQHIESGMNADPSTHLNIPLLI